MNRDQWLDPQEWRELGEATAHCYEEVAKEHGLDINNRKHRPFIDIAYRLRVGDDVGRFMDLINAGKRGWGRQMRPAMAAKRARAESTRGSVLRAYEELRKEKGLRGLSSVRVARRAARASGRDISPRHVRRILKTASRP